ncbi:MAG: hypothetical protein LIR50_21365 [Bacillota bacterium]|nr:hypothetical protein [Bacillota bacterium]
MKSIYFDMDGTIANLYAVEDWLPKLRAYDPSPYEEAAPLLRLCYLARLLNRLQRLGYYIGVVSWLSKDPDPDYGEAVTAAKLAWLKKHLPSVKWNEIVIIPHGTAKSSAVSFIGILFDDEQPNRTEWENNNGKAFSEKEILEVLRSLC